MIATLRAIFASPVQKLHWINTAVQVRYDQNKSGWLLWKMRLLWKFPIGRWRCILTEAGTPAVLDAAEKWADWLEAFDKPAADEIRRSLGV